MARLKKPRTMKALKVPKMRAGKALAKPRGGMGGLMSGGGRKKGGLDPTL
jgi:hypothetical protein